MSECKVIAIANQKGGVGKTTTFRLGVALAKDGIYLIPSNLNLSLTEANIFNAMSREYLIRDCLGELKKDYNYILIDCMPSLSMLTTKL